MDYKTKYCGWSFLSWFRLLSSLLNFFAQKAHFGRPPKCTAKRMCRW